MKNKIGLIIVAVLLMNQTIAQNEEFTGSSKVSVKWGPELKSKKGSTLTNIIGYDESGIYAVRTKGAYYWGSNMEHFDNSYDLTKSVEFDLRMSNKKMRMEMILHLNDKLYLFSSFTDQKAKENGLYYQTINKKNMEPEGTPMEIAIIDYSGHTKFNSGYFGYDLSRDSSKILVYYNTPYESGEAESFGLKVYDNEMNRIWEQQITLPYMDKKFNLVDYIVDNEGNVHLIGKLYQEGTKDKVRGEANYTYQVLSYSENGEKFEEYEIKLQDKFITDMKVAITNDMNIICGGFYSEKGTFSIKGSYFMKIDGKTKEVLLENTKEFGMDFITQNMTEKQEQKAKKKEDKGKRVELYEYDLDNILIREDGGVVLIGEQFYIRVTHTTTYSNGVPNTVTHYHYYYNDIIAVNISPEGNIEWTQKIAKRQHTIDDGGFFSSYAMAVVGDKLYFFFNDNPKNLEYSGSGKVEQTTTKRSVVTMVELDAEGNQERESLFSYKEAEVLCRPKVSRQIDDHRLVLFGQKKSKQRFMEVTFK